MSNRHPVSTTPPPERTRSWWGALRDMIGGFWNIAGAPEDILALSVLTREDYNFFETMLRGLEALIRRLLLIQAADAPAPVFAAPRKGKARNRKSAKAPEAPDPERPETWRVSFRLAIKKRRRAQEPTQIDDFAARMAQLHAPKNEPNRFANAQPLARRFEALLRVFDAPELYVARLARAIAKDKALLRGFLAIPSLPPWAGAQILEEVKPLMQSAWDILALRPSPNTS